VFDVDGDLRMMWHSGLSAVRVAEAFVFSDKEREEFSLATLSSSIFIEWVRI
jgi:hypothetical protein